MSKGSDSKYRPTAGARCLISGPNCDDDSGYVFFEGDILWCDEVFVLYGNDGKWPVLNKWDHVLMKPMEEVAA